MHVAILAHPLPLSFWNYHRRHGEGLSRSDVALDWLGVERNCPVCLGVLEDGRAKQAAPTSLSF